MATDNPIWMVQNALWSTLEGYPGFASAVADRRRLKDTQGDWVPDTVSTADGPLVRIRELASEPHIERTSNGSSLVLRYAIEVSTTSQKVESICETRWAILRAMCGWATYLGVLEWDSEAFVKDFKFVQEETSDSNRELNRGIHGWATVVMCQVQCWFATEAMRPA